MNLTVFFGKQCIKQMIAEEISHLQQLQAPLTRTVS